MFKANKIIHPNLQERATKEMKPEDPVWAVLADENRAVLDQDTGHVGKKIFHWRSIQVVGQQRQGIQEALELGKLSVLLDASCIWLHMEC